jgi:hypothetical protein
VSEKRTVTDTLVKAMEEAGEATECLVIMTTTDGHILSLGTSDARVIRMGLLETAKQWMIADMHAESTRREE